RAGTLSLSSTTMLAVLRDLLATAAVTGVRRLLLLNGHGGNEDLARQAVRDTALDHRVVAAAVGYWSLAWDDIRDIGRRHGIGPVPGHAGSFEASLMLALRPALVSAAPARRSGPDATSIAYQPHPLAGPVVEQHRWVHRIGGY